jgi:phosphate transport system substrate-binding protein
VKAGDYPLTAPMYLYLPARRLPKLARDFLAYLRTDSAQQVIRRVGLVDQKLEELPLDAQGGRLINAIRAAGPEVSLEELQRMAALFADNHRLTISFRFRDGSAALDAASLSNVGLLAAALESGAFDGRTLTFVGFTDGQGEAAANLRLARRRADAVKKAVLNEAEAFDPGAVTLASDAFGEALPMACDDTAWGRKVNRRVEIWVK